MDNEMLTTRDVSKQYKLTESSLEKWRVAGVGPEYMKLSRKVMYRRTDVERWLSENRRRSTSDSARKNEREGCAT